MDLALVGSRSTPAQVDDRRLRDALTAAGATVTSVAWEDPAAPWDGYALALVRAAPADVAGREAFVAWAVRAAERTRLLPPADVLRWNTHRSYLLELEDRGAPVVPSAWLGRGDDIDLSALLAARDWTEVVVRPAVGAGGAVVVDAREASGREAGQRHLDTLLGTDDALVQPWAPVRPDRGPVTVVLAGGAVSHAVRTVVTTDADVRAGGGPVATVMTADELDADLARLAVWVLETTAIEGLAVAAVELIPGEDGTPQLAALDAVAPELHLGVLPDAADRLAAAVLAAAG